MNASEPGTFAGDHETLQHEGVLPSQFYGRRKPDTTDAKLYHAILEGAIRDIEGRNSAEGGDSKLPPRLHRLYAQAMDWFFEDPEESSARVPFWLVCEGLEIDIDYFRMKLKQGLVGQSPHKRYDNGRGNNQIIAA